MNRLRELRQARGLTMQQVAVALKLDYSMVGYIERGQKNFSIASLKNAADYFCVSTDFLLGYTQEEILTKFIDSHYGDFIDVSTDQHGEVVEMYRDSSNIVNLKFSIITILKDLDSMVALEKVYSFAKCEQAKFEFSNKES